MVQPVIICGYPLITWVFYVSVFVRLLVPIPLINRGDVCTIMNESRIIVFLDPLHFGI